MCDTAASSVVSTIKNFVFMRLSELEYLPLKVYMYVCVFDVMILCGHDVTPETENAPLQLLKTKLFYFCDT